VIIDSSALVAILLAEPAHEALVDQLARAAVVGVGAPTLAETGIVLTARIGVAGRLLLARLLVEADIETVPYTAAHWPVVVDAFARYRKGGHPAALNFGDCLTYATCRLAGRPLLCTGENFPRTDLAVLPPS
jgi:ribonuclease VapC